MLWVGELPPLTHHKRVFFLSFAVGGRGSQLPHCKRGKNPSFVMGERGKLPPSPSHPPQKRDTPLIRGGPSSTVGRVQFPWSIKYSLPPSITCDTPVTRMPLPIKRTNLLQFALTDQFVQTSAFSLPPNSPPFVASPPQTSLAKSPIPTTASAPMSLSKTALKVTHTFETPLYQELLFHLLFSGQCSIEKTPDPLCVGIGSVGQRRIEEEKENHLR